MTNMDEVGDRSDIYRREGNIVMFNDNQEPCSTLTYLHYRNIAHNYAPQRTSLLPLIHGTMLYQKVLFNYVNGMSVPVILNILSTRRNVTENILSYRLFPTASSCWTFGALNVLCS